MSRTKHTPFLFSIALFACGNGTEKQPLPTSDTAAPTPDTTGASSGAFVWVAWDQVPPAVKDELRTYGYPQGKDNVGDDTQAAFDDGCDVQVAQHDFNGDGVPGIVITKQCMDWCGTAGCAFDVYEDHGKLRIGLVDHVEAVAPARNGVTTSAGIFMPLEAMVP